ncbi:hypothetical protein [Bacillus atrophaeus]|uniref:hypothetical protein n=1 Tax=Bacillus atrophaeus TaxID=1452 RepID=UPI002281028E|nr:hypothetical protein [Bacillus atrophaeus]MCY8515607.1 hypothetical protein [Bacillus atrophaeus]MCY8992844.1 hypothetical protein [Bacillus atrophaeus]
MYAVVYSVLILAYITSQLFTYEPLNYTVGAAAVIAIIISFRKASGLYLYTGLIFMLLGALLFITSDLPYYTFLLHFQSMLGLLSLFFMLPFINSLIRVGHFDTQLNQLLNVNTAKMNQLYKKSSFVTHILGMFLNIATIPLLVSSLKPSLAAFPDGIRNQIYAKNLLRAYALCLSWSPVEVLVSVTIDATGLKYYHIAPVTFCMMILFIWLDWMLFSRKPYSAELLAPPDTDRTVNKRRIKKKTIHLGAMLLSFIATVTIVDTFIGHGYLFSVVLTIIPFSVLFSLSMKKSKQYIMITIPHWKVRTVSLSNYMFMFLCAGFFVEMALQTKEIAYLQNFLISSVQHIFVFYLLISLFFLATALAGFHPLVSLALMTSLLEPAMPQLAALPTALVLLTSSIATVMYSPFNVSVSLLAGELKMNPYQITKTNLLFALSYMLAGILIASLMTLLM